MKVLFSDVGHWLEELRQDAASEGTIERGIVRISVECATGGLGALEVVTFHAGYRAKGLVVEVERKCGSGPRSVTGGPSKDARQLGHAFAGEVSRVAKELGLQIRGGLFVY